MDVDDVRERADSDLNGITHTFPDDVDVLLARTSGANLLLMSDVGGGTDVVGVNLTFSDAASGTIPDAGPLVSGTFKPSNIGGGDVFPTPAPAPSAGSVLSVFKGTNPNGLWNLWVDDDVNPDDTTASGYGGLGATRAVTQGTTTTGVIGVTDNFVNNFKIIGPHPGNNILIHENFHVTVNANGTLTAFVDNFSAECK